MGRYRKNIIIKGQMLSFALIALLFASCASQKDITDKEYIYKDRVVYDSIFDSVYIRDSIYIKELGDTIFVDRWHTNIKYKYITSADTIRDTITSTKIEEVVKEKRIFNWYDFLIAFIVGALMCYALFIYLKSDKRL